jgi:hypothetical protein
LICHVRPPATRKATLERFQAKWKPVRVKKTRQIKNLEPRFDPIEAETAQAEFSSPFHSIGSWRGPRTVPSDQVTWPAGSSLKSGIRFSHSSIATVISGLEAACRRVVEVAVDVVRHNVGVVRAASQYESIYPERWGTIRATGGAMVDLAMPLLLARMGRGRTPAKMRSIGFAFQMMFGTLCNAVLHKPKLVSLDQSEMVDRLALAMFLQLQHEARLDRAAK